MTTRGQQTIRFPEGLLDEVREEVEIRGTSLNDFVVKSIEKEIRQSKALRLLEEIDRHRREIGKRGKQPDSTPLIRAMREGDERR